MAHAHRIIGIDCEGAAVAGIRKALSERFEDMTGKRREATKWKDPEGVHSMRVASRRLRSALGDFMPYVNKRSFSSIHKQIRSIADALGEVRDQDVAILALEKLQSETPPEFSAPLQMLIDTRKELRSTSRQELKRVLVKDRMKDLSSDFENALNGGTEFKGGSRTTPFAGTYQEIAKAIIRDRLGELETLSLGLYQPLEAIQLHEMRIGAKRLRYSIELFADCWDSNILAFAKNSARIQTALGKVHDCDVWIESFRKEILDSKKHKQPEQTQTFTWLFSHFNEQRHASFQEAFSLWTAWEKEGVSENLRESIKS